MPIMQLLLFGYAINTDPKHLPTAVVMADQGPFARARWRRWPTAATSTLVATAADEAEPAPCWRGRGAVRGDHPPISRATWCAASARRCWWRPTPPIRPRPATPSAALNGRGWPTGLAP
jgi:hypothetical protein